MKKPKLSFWDVWNMSFGFLGIQFGFSLQNANASRILQTFGADVEHLSWFWLVAPITGMLVQPIIGHYSDRTWTKMGRRKPYFLIGAILASVGLILMPNSGALATVIPALYIGAGMLMIMDASFNIAMEPFRALVADKLAADQRTLGFSIQTVLIGIGAVIGSWLPYILTNWFNIDNVGAEENMVAPNLIWSFFIGAFVLIASILVTVLKTKEYSPEEVASFEEENDDQEIISEHSNDPFLVQVVKDFKDMPSTMKQLGLVQFCSWFALFGMWVYATPAIASHVFGTTDEKSSLYNDAGDWVGILFGVYNLVSAVYAFFLPAIAAKVGRKRTHAINLFIGGLGLLSIFFFKNQYLLLISMVGVGIAWASILAMPYAILAGAIPARKMGIYMGIFNFFITVPQILNGIIGGPLIKYAYNGQSIYALMLSGVFLIIGAWAVRFVDDADDVMVANAHKS